jgi:hypothetical protein
VVLRLGLRTIAAVPRLSEFQTTQQES